MPNPSKEAEIKALSASLDAMPDWEAMHNDRVKELIATQSALDESDKVIIKFGRHSEFCRGSWSKTKICDCGFDKAKDTIAKLKESK